MAKEERAPYSLTLSIEKQEITDKKSETDPSYTKNIRISGTIRNRDDEVDKEKIRIAIDTFNKTDAPKEHRKLWGEAPTKINWNGDRGEWYYDKPAQSGKEYEFSVRASIGEAWAELDNIKVEGNPTTLIREISGEKEATCNQTVKYKVTRYNRDAADISEADKKNIKWAVKVDDKQEELKEKGEAIELKIKKEWEGKEIIVMAYMQSPSEKVSVKTDVCSKEVIRIEITSEITGYTIQALKGIDFIFSDPVVIVPTYRTNIWCLNLNAENKTIKEKKEGSFSVTRDAWYCLGKNKSNKYEILNRAFVPADYDKNLYSLMWIPSYPKRSNADAFILTRFGDRKIPAKPLKTQKCLNGRSIDSPRSDENFATDIMLHIGGTYEIMWYDHVGGSYGCFGFIPDDDIYSTVEKAKKASENDDYDDKTSNEDWKIIADKIKRLAFPEKKALQLIIRDRDESKNYFPTEILKE